MKHISFYQWLVNSGANTQKPGLSTCHNCGDRGFVLRGTLANCCLICGDQAKFNRLFSDYVAQKNKDEKLVTQISQPGRTS
jgi:hypothetical protein